MEENIRNLILVNYIQMFKRKDIAAISDFMNNPKAITSFLRALGASEEMMNMPAHRETLESCLKTIVSSTLSAVQDGESGLEVEYLEHGIKTHTESLMHEEKYTLEFDKGIYTFDVERNVGEVSKSIMASVEKKGFIASRTQNFPMRALSKNSTTITKYLNLDEAGFVIGEATQENDKTKIIKRDGMKNFVDEDKKGITWNGNPNALNEKSASAKEFQQNMCRTIAKYPETRAYYENFVGKEIVDKAVRLLKTREDNS